MLRLPMRNPHGRGNGTGSVWSKTMKQSPRWWNPRMEGGKSQYSRVGGSIDWRDRRVKYFHIGTHSREIETEIREIFGRFGWTCRADWPGNREQQTPFGTIVLEDGVQSWANPKLCSGGRFG